METIRSLSSCLMTPLLDARFSLVGKGPCDYALVTATECALFLLLPLALIETVVYAALSPIAKLFSCISNKPFLCFKKLLTSSAFSILWIGSELFQNLNPLRVHVESKEIRARNALFPRWNRQQKPWMAILNKFPKNHLNTLNILKIQACLAPRIRVEICNSEEEWNALGVSNTPPNIMAYYLISDGRRLAAQIPEGKFFEKMPFKGIPKEKLLLIIDQEKRSSSIQEDGSFVFEHIWPVDSLIFSSFAGQKCQYTTWLPEFDYYLSNREIASRPI